MSAITPLTLLAALATALTTALVVRAIVRPPPRLAGRVRPYVVHAGVRLGRPTPGWLADDGDRSLLRRFLEPALRPMVARVTARLGDTGQAALRRRLRQARALQDVPDEQRVAELHVREALSAIAGAAAGFVVGLVLVGTPGPTLALAAGGAVIGASRHRAALDRVIEERRERLRVELYTVNHLLAMHVRVGGGIVQALQRVVDRGNGELVTELADVLRAHGSGLSLRDALLHAAAETPEPHVARTLRLLGAGAEYGTDLAGALLAHSDDVREARREALRRQATKRRAAMLIPIIAVLAPVMLLFIAAPLPSLIFGNV